MSKQLLSNDDFNNLFLRENLKRLRIKNGLSTIAIAKIINKSRQAYANYEAGLREISIHDLIVLPGFYHVSVDDILGNPFTNRNNNTLSFRSYEILDDGSIRPTVEKTINTANDDVIVVKRNEKTIDFYWRTQMNQKGKVMLFEYNNQLYSSKVFFQKDKGWFFFVHEEPQYFNKVQVENLIFIGVFASSLTKDFNIPNFF
jgi:transcriptional regulator with XRE-family HTH domain